MIASEATPFAKTGGLADVMGALPQALQARGDQTAVCMPRYAQIPIPSARVYSDLTIWLGSTAHRVDIYRAEHGGVPYFMIDSPALFEREGLYGNAQGDYPDNHVRFAVLSRAAMEVARRVFRPDVVHCHDWQSALVPVYMRTRFATDPAFIGLRLLFTIHNLGYQGIFPATAFPDLGLDPSLFRPEYLEFFGDINLMKGALLLSDALSTVSRGYAREIQTDEFGFALQGVLRSRSSVLTGIVNGVDYNEWDPSTDPHIAARYSAADLSGKRECKRDLLGELGLQPNLDRPLIGIISRFVDQKGFDLIAEIGGKLMTEDVGLAVLGTGAPAYEQFFRDLAAAHPDRVGARIAYDNRLAHKIEAGADMFLMPSWFEPCGLNQMYSLRYGTVPIVRATGGLDDTIDETTGFKFTTYDAEALLAAIRSALEAFGSRGRWLNLMLAGMAKDYSWAHAAGDYSELYRSMLAAPAVGVSI
jgi:starch synthase